MLSWLRRQSLPIKITTSIVLIFVVFTGITEWIEEQLLHRTIDDNIRNTAMAVERSINQKVASRGSLSNRAALADDLQEIMTTLPALLNIVVYAFPAEPGTNPVPITSAGPTELPRQEGAPVLVQQARNAQGPLVDYAKRMTIHQAHLAAPILLNEMVIGATYAELSTLQMDEAIEAFRRISRIRRLMTAVVIVVVINLFLYFKVHRPLRRVLTAIEEISRGSMTAAVPVKDRDELGNLADRFNHMVKQIRETTEDNKRLTESLRQANDDLQNRVIQATAELMEKNRALVHTNELLTAAQREASRAERLSTIGQMAATVAHKIGTPLTALSGHIQLMAEDPTLSEESRRRLRTVEEQIERTSRIIHEMLTYARRPDLVRSPLDLNACVAEALALFRPEMDRRRIMLVNDWAPLARKVEGDAHQLCQAFGCLIENALDAMPSGGTFTVNTSARVPVQPHARACVAVEFVDTGGGMEPEQQAQIFQPFFTTKKAGSGTGLGLAIALETVRLHGGSIEVESERGKGSRFTVVLPVDGEAR